MKIHCLSLRRISVPQQLHVTKCSWICYCRAGQTFVIVVSPAGGFWCGLQWKEPRLDLPASFSHTNFHLRGALQLKLLIDIGGFEKYRWPYPSSDRGFQALSFLNITLIGNEVQSQYCVHMCTQEVKTVCHNPKRYTIWLHIILHPFQKTWA